MANPISAAASQKYQIQSINKDSNNNLLNEVKDFDRQSSYTNIFNTKTTNAINSSNTSVIEDTENSNTETSAIIETINTEISNLSETFAIETSEISKTSDSETFDIVETSHTETSEVPEISDSETSEAPETPNIETSETPEISDNETSEIPETPNIETSDTLETPDSEVPDSDTNTTEFPDIEDSETAFSSEETTDEESTLAENTTDISTEISIDSDLETRIENAVFAFQKILQQKPLMALLYRTENYAVPLKAGSFDDTTATISSGHTLYITDVEILDGEVWYQTHFWNDGVEHNGYIEGYYLAHSDEEWIAWEKEYLNATYGIAKSPDRTDSSDIRAFPSIYQDSLRTLKELHPSWVFVPMRTGLDFNTVVSNQMGAKSLIQNTTSNASKGWVGSACPTESGWFYATKPAVAHYLNPCNFLTESYIFQFEQQTFNSTYHNVSAIQNFLNNTFMKGKIPGDTLVRTYAQAFYEIGRNRKLSPIHLASRVYQEQGNGTSALISGTYKGYEGYYNYFNVGVNGSSTEEKIRKGLTYAKQKGWNSRFKSLEGGAATIGNNYILKGQDTIYLEKFNVDVNSPHGLYNHQYMQNIQAPASESLSTKKMYAGAGSLNSGFVFKIPVYENMPGEKAIQSLSLNQTELLLYRPDTIANMPVDQPLLNATANLSVSITPADTIDDKTITWTSSNPKIVTVKANETTQGATVSAVSAGEAVITAKSQNGKTAKCKVQVKAPIYSLKLTNLNTEIDSAASTLYTGQSITLTADYMPKDTTSDTHIVWTSKDPSIASVLDGNVTALSKGTTIISASMAGFSANYEINVEECTVTFLTPDFKVLSVISAEYGKTISANNFPSMDSTSEKLFIGWYTQKNGQGTLFDTNTKVYDNNIILYPHFEQQGKGFYVVPVGDQVYTGTAIKPQVYVYDSVSYADGSTELVALVSGQDYTISYKNNKNVNTSSSKPPTITIKGKGNYSGIETVTFNILPKALTDHDITIDNISIAYNGKVQKSLPSVYRNGKKLTNKTDYTLSYPYSDAGAYKNAGVYPIVIKGTKNYKGTRTIYQTISTKTLLSKVSIAKIPNQVYKNELVDKTQNIGIIPDKLYVTYQNKPLIQSTDGGKTGDFTVSYANNMEVGTATATITAVEGSAYAGSKSISYKITGTNINKAKVEGLVPKTYTGIESDVWQNNVRLTVNNILLKESKDNGITGDYIVSYANTSKAGTASIQFQGINAYAGKLKKTYKITGYALSNDNHTPNTSITMAYCTEDAPLKQIPITSLSQIISPYIKGGAKPKVILYHNGKELVSGRDYTVSYSKNTTVTTDNTPVNKLPQITIKGKGSFRGTLTGTWRITDGAMSNKNNKLHMTAKDISFQNKPGIYKTTLTIIDANGKKLIAGKDYDKKVVYTYVNDTQVSTTTGLQILRKAGEPIDNKDIINADTQLCATVKGIGAYAGNGNASLSTTYRIVTADIAKAKVKTAVKTYQNGREIRLDASDIKLTVNNIALVYGKDYIIDENSYTNNTKKGKATVILRGIGKNYGGQRKITFTIQSKTLAWWKNTLNYM